MEYETVKKGWIHFRKRNFFVTKWEPKWLVLYSSPEPSFAIYNERSQAIAPYQPKIHAGLQDCVVSKPKSVFNEKNADSTFVINVKSGKFYICAESPKECDEWIKAIRSFSKPAKSRNATILKEPECKYSPFIHSGHQIFSGNDIQLLLQDVDHILGETDYHYNQLTKIQSLNDVASLENMINRDLDVVFMSNVSNSEKNLNFCRMIGNFNELACTQVQKVIESGRFEPEKDVNCGLVTLRIESQPTKIMSRELQGINAINHLGLQNLQTLLMTIIQYKGFSVAVKLNMKLNDQTIIVDQARCPPLVNQNVINSMKQYGAALSLRERVMRWNEEEISVPLCPYIQAHSYNGKIFLTNLNCLLPNDLSIKNDSLTQFRENFVHFYEKKLPCTLFVAEEDAANDSCELELLHASKHLVNNYIPQIISKLDNLDIIIFDSEHFTEVLHDHGINIRYLGVIAANTLVPHVKEQALIEIVARCFKQHFNKVLRYSVLHFIQVNASKIEDELRLVAVNLVQSIMRPSVQFWEQNLKEQSLEYQYELEYDELCEIHKPALFKAIKYHCGLSFVQKMFNERFDLDQSDFIDFEPRVKSLDGFGVEGDNIQLQKLCSDVLLQQPSLKLCKNSKVARRCYDLASEHSSDLVKSGYYNDLALAFVPKYHPLSSSILVQSLAIRVKCDSTFIDSPQFVAILNVAYEWLEYSMGDDHSLFVFLHETMAGIYQTTGRYEKAREYFEKALSLCIKILGKTHSLTTSFLIQSGMISQEMKEYKDAITKFREASYILEQVNDNDSKVQLAVVLYHLSDTIKLSGDLHEALEKAIKGSELCEDLYDLSDPRVIQSYHQVLSLAQINLPELSAMITKESQDQLQIVINYQEKVYEYLKVNGSEADQFDVIKIIILCRLKMLPPGIRSTVASIRNLQRDFGQDYMKKIILKIVAMSPSLFVETIVSKLGTPEAQDELVAILQIIDNNDIKLE